MSPPISEQPTGGKDRRDDPAPGQGTSASRHVPGATAEWCIKLQGTAQVETMLDPFLGIGNSGVAAKRCDVQHFIGFEIDQTYLTEAKRRLAGRDLRLG